MLLTASVLLVLRSRKLPPLKMLASLSYLLALASAAIAAPALQIEVPAAAPAGFNMYVSQRLPVDISCSRRHI